VQHHQQQSLARNARTLILAHQPLTTSEQHAHAVRLATPRQRHCRTGLADGVVFRSMRRDRASRCSASQRRFGRRSRRRRLHVGQRNFRLASLIPTRHDRKARIRMPSCTQDYPRLSSDRKGHSLPQTEECWRKELGRMSVVACFRRTSSFLFCFGFAGQSEGAGGVT
jgi:hypothetical protein